MIVRLNDDFNRALYSMKGRLTPVNSDLLSKFKMTLKNNEVVTLLYDYCRNYFNSIGCDLGNGFNEGCNTYDIMNVKLMLKQVTDKCFIAFRGLNGTLYYDIPHFAIACELMKVTGRSVDDIQLVKVLGILANIEDISDCFATYKKGAGKAGGIKLDVNSDSLCCNACPDLWRKYALYMLTPTGYTCYYYEPSNLIQCVFLANIVEMQSDAIRPVLSEGRGILIDELPLSVESKFGADIFGKKFAYLSGKFAGYYQNLYSNSLSDNSYGTIYSGVIAPYMSRIMGKFINLVNTDLAENQTSSQDCYFNQVLPSRVGICIRNGLDIRQILPTVCENYGEHTLPNGRTKKSQIKTLSTVIDDKNKYDFLLGIATGDLF